MGSAIEEVHLSSLEEISLARELLKESAANVAVFERPVATYRGEIKKFFELKREFWFLKERGSVKYLSAKLWTFLSTQAGLPPSTGSAIFHDVAAILGAYCGGKSHDAFEISLYARSLPYGIDYFRRSDLAYPHFDELHARLIATLCGPGTMYAPKASFNHEGLQLFGARQSELLRSVSPTNESQVLIQLEELQKNPPFIESPGGCRQLCENAIAVFSGSKLRPEMSVEDYFWHWFPYSSEWRMFLVIDNVGDDGKLC